MSTLSGGPNIVVDGLVLALDAANTKSYVSGSTIWNDLSRSNNNGTLTNGPTFNTGSGGSISFDGTNDYASTNFPGILGNNPRTMSIWFRPDVSQNRNLLGYGTGTATRMWDVILFQGLVGIHLYNSGAEAGTPYTVGVWQNITFTYADPNIISYMNGVLKVTRSYPGINTGDANTLSIAQGVFVSYRYFDGLIGLVQTYNRALSSQEVLQNYNATKTRFGF